MQTSLCRACAVSYSAKGLLERKKAELSNLEEISRIRKANLLAQAKAEAEAAKAEAEEAEALAKLRIERAITLKLKKKC